MERRASEECQSVGTSERGGRVEGAEIWRRRGRSREVAAELEGRGLVMRKGSDVCKADCMYCTKGVQ